MSVTNINKADMNQQPNDKQTICIVIPCYNEEEVLPWAMGKLQTMIGKMKAETGIEGRLLLVDDGSRDRTWELIEGFAAEHSNVAGVKLYGGVSGSADAAVQALLDGSLAYNPNVQCNHHGEGHGHGEAGHSCGHHGEGQGHSCGGHGGCSNH